MNEKWVKEIQDRTKKIPTSSGRSNKLNKVSFEDLVFVPAQLNKRAVDYFREEIETKTVIGKESQKPVELKTPIIIGAMSFGALSKEAKIALAKASTMAGTIENTGEGGMLPEEREFSKYLTIQYSTGRFGITEEILKKADVVEIKIGQGAKGGQGGLLPKEKVNDEIARVRNVPPGKDIHSSPVHLDIRNVEDLKEKVKWLREITEGVPIIIKLAAGDIENDIKLAVKADPDIIAIDGIEGGTGAAPEVMLNEVGVPTLCPKGVTTQDPELRKNLNIEEASQNAANYIKNCTEEIKMIAGACGENNIHKLKKENLRALNSEIAKITKIRLVSE